jgi:hypothetical protein
MFYVLLPSNSSFDYYPENTVAHYKTRLAQDYALSGDWEVALTEIQYTRNWVSFEENEAEFVLIKLHDDGIPKWVEIKSAFESLKKSLPAGYYANKGEIIQAILDMTEMEVKNEMSIGWDSKSNIVTLNMSENVIFHPNAYLEQLLGFPLDLKKTCSVQELCFRNGIFRSTNKEVLNNRLTALYVYCDIVKPRPVGDSMANLLRCVPVTGEHGKVVYRSFHNLQYVDLDRYHFNEIEIDIRDDTGRRVPFEGGRLVVTLHFRKKSLVNRNNA